MFKHPAYVVLDLPMQVAEEVAELRRQAGRAFPPLPVEITVAGSSGVGPMLGEQSQEFIFGRLAQLAAATVPLAATVEAIERFPGSPVMYLSVKDPAPFIALHQAIIGTPIRFGPTPFPYLPHCAIRSHAAGNPDETQERRVKSLPVPLEPFILDAISVYELDGQKRECRQLFRTTLSAR